MQARLKIGGMHCHGCARAVRAALSRIEGVADVSVDLDGGWAEIRSAHPVEPEKLRAAVEDAGYRASAG